MQFALRHPSAYVRRALLPPGDPGTAARWMWFRLLRTLHPRKRGQDGEHHAGRVVRSLDVLRERPAAWGRTPVLLYGFDDITRLQFDVIETLGRIVDAEVTVTLAYEPGRTAFAGRAATYHALAPLASQLRELPAPSTAQACSPLCANSRRPINSKSTGTTSRMPPMRRWSTACRC